jgi:NAD(P)-dependent dehydrogenase (short-subunit alcohol dehydrogenase family)
VKLGDLFKPETGRLLVERAVVAFGGLNVLVANAGFPDRRQIGSLDRTGLDYCFAVISGGFFEMLCDSEAMKLHLAEITTQVAPGAHAVVLLDQAGWRLSDRLRSTGPQDLKIGAFY